MDEKEHHSNPNPVVRANVISRLFFWWLNPLFKIGSQRPLEVDDMYSVLEENSSKTLSSELQKNWEHELKSAKEGRKPRLFKAIIKTFGKSWALCGIICFIEEFIKIIQPLMLAGLIRYFYPDSGVTKTWAYLYALGLSLSSIVIAIAHHPYFYQCQIIGMRIRIACCALIYQKALRLSNKSFGKTTVGHIVNLLSNDVNRFDQFTLFLHFLWIGPLQAIAVLIILWYMIGPATLAGFGVLLLLTPVQGSMGKLFSKLRNKVAKQTDQRVRIMNEILNGIRVIKMYCWENLFSDLVHKVRRVELKYVGFTVTTQAGLVLVNNLGVRLLMLLVVTTRVLTSGRVEAYTIFPALGLFYILRGSFFSRVSMALQFAGQGYTSVCRIKEFLVYEELEDSDRHIHSTSPTKSDDCKVIALQVVASWDKSLVTPTLNDISVEVRPGELLAVIGPVGAGKSSLLMALLGELPLTSGSVKMVGRVAYASQLPWVFSASVRQNILFGLPYDPKKYQRVLMASALVKDLELMPERDMTLVGERGVSLSGGQKARISLARALYYDADVYLLDDPLSAVDSAVSRHLFDKCIRGFLRNKPVVLVTHQLQYLRQADKILVLKQGEVLGLGTYDELEKCGTDFISLIEEAKTEDGDKDSMLPLEVATSVHPSDIMFSQTPDFAVQTYEPKLSTSFDPKCLLYRMDSHEHEDADHTNAVDLAKSTKSLYGPMDNTVRKRSGKTYRPLSPTRVLDALPAGVGSMASLGSMDANIVAEYVAPVQAEEQRDVGNISYRYYFKYLWAGGGFFGFLFFVIFNILAQTTYILSDWWLSYWSTQEESHKIAVDKHERLLAEGYNITNVTIPELEVNRFLYIYAGIIGSVFISGLVRSLLIFFILVRASRKLHNKMFVSIIRSPILFFDSNPTGRILNRFSKDMGSLDETLPLLMYDFITCGLMILGIVLVAGIVNPWVFIPVTPLVVVFLFLRRFYLRTSRDIKRLEATTRSPVFTHLSATLQGLHTIRAFGAQDAFATEFNNHQDLHTEAWYLFLSTSRWFAVRLDLLCALFITAVACTSVLASSVMSGGLVGLSLTYAISLMGLFQWGVRQSAEVENQMTSVERVYEYIGLPSEPALESKPENKPDESWPKYGILTAEKAVFRYKEDSPAVLKGLNFCIRAEEKVGIVGRTGAGKSSIIAMFFRLAEPEGLIRIDGVDIKSLGIHDLRGCIAIIPQDPVLFVGTIRRNMDPFSQHTDSALWKALEEVEMKPYIMELPGQLEAQISEGGSNFSVGQRQLLCLARAILRKNKILVIDEATANVDTRTDALIQQTIRDKFRQCTVLTIAHRLNTIMDSDRIMVLSEGKIVEYDDPYLLLQNEEGVFHEMVSQTGPEEQANLLSIAEECHSRKLNSSSNSLKETAMNGNKVLPTSDPAENGTK